MPFIIDFEMSDYVCVTDCPHNMKNEYGVIIKVGSVKCEACEYHTGISSSNTRVVCRYKPKEPEVFNVFKFI